MEEVVESQVSSVGSLITEREIAKRLGVRYDTVRRWLSLYKPTKIQGVYHFGRAVRIDYPVFVNAFPGFLQSIRSEKQKRKRVKKSRNGNSLSR